MKKWLLIFALPFLIQAEILEVRPRWNAFKCQDLCTPGLKRYFSEVPGVTAIRIDSRAGIAYISFAKNQPFDYNAFRYAASYTGAEILTMWVKVVGRIVHDNQNIFLISRGDGTIFTLLSPVNPIPWGNTPDSIETHFLTPELTAKLLDAEKMQQTLVISGPLFYPRKYTNYLIVADMERVKQGQDLKTFSQQPL